MELTQQQFEKNLESMEETEQNAVITLIEDADEDALELFAKTLGVTLALGEPVTEEPVT